jgi:flagellar biosynthetic protein FliP
MTTFSVLRNKHFLRHYLEMVAAMVAGMVVLGLPAEQGLRLIGSSTDALSDSAPWASLLGMATIMTIPMVALMRWRGHAWRPVWEMSASMYVPTFLAIVLVEAGVLDYMPGMMLEHVVMLPAMLVAMLLRPDEYAHHDHGAGAYDAAMMAAAREVAA